MKQDLPMIDTHTASFHCMDDARQFALQPDAITAQQKEGSIDGKEKEKEKKQVGSRQGRQQEKTSLFSQPLLLISQSLANLSIST